MPRKNIIFIFLLALTPVSQAAELAVSQIPLSIANATPSNVFFMIDDSGSMDWSLLTRNHWHYTAYIYSNARPFYNTTGNWIGYTNAAGEACRNLRDARFGYIYRNEDDNYKNCELGAALNENLQAARRDWRIYSHDFNVLYYNPNVDYKPWPGYPDANFHAARSHPDRRMPGYTKVRDLTGFIYETVQDDKSFAGSAPMPGAMMSGVNGLVDLWDTHIRYEIGANNIRINRFSYQGLSRACDGNAYLENPPYRSCLGARVETLPIPDRLSGRTLKQTQQNIANWYQYHRKRYFVTKAALAEVVKAVPTLRYGLSMANNYGSLFVQFPLPGENFALHNDKLLDQLFAYPQKSSHTPLRTALQRVGQYYQGQLSGMRNPYISECQQSFSLLLTDGYWNGANPGSEIGDADGDGKPSTLADVARYYYARDLSALPDRVPGNNKKQHMSTFTLAFGIEGVLKDTDGDGWPDPLPAVNGNWGAPSAKASEAPEKIDDLWHAAFNSDGRFISARTPQEVRDGLIGVIETIAGRGNASTSVGINSGSISEDSLIFRATFDAVDWTGDLKAFNLDSQTGAVLTEQWSARKKLATVKSDDRVILTSRSDNSRGVKFAWPANHLAPASHEITAEQAKLLLASGTVANPEQYGQAVVDYLRGTESPMFRKRAGRLGDIVHSTPVFVGQPKRRYPDFWGESASENGFPYSDFRKIQRPAVVYAGANDGLLHGFLASSGKEVLAYVPAGVYENLHRLTRADYAHQYFVDGPVTVEDVFFNTRKETRGWHTVLLGALGAGGRSIYALDTTNPENFSESHADKIVLWEFMDADLGLTLGQPAIGRLANGMWAAIFGNGYNSDSGHGVIYVLNIETGQILKKFDTGLIQDPWNEDRPNGISSPVLVDLDQDQVVDWVYAGDLFGHLWKLDLSSANPEEWHLSSLFHAVNAQGKAQPITVRPEVGLHPDDESVVIYFGTGKYFEVSDNSLDNQPVQSFYAIRDQGKPVVASQLLRQKIVQEIPAGGKVQHATRMTTNTPVDWDRHQGWALDLMPGERVVENPVLRAGKIIFPTLLPSKDTCDASGSGWVMELMATTGVASEHPLIDLNGDGVISNLDKLPDQTEVIYPSGFREPDGAGAIPSAPAILMLDNAREYKYIGSSNGAVNRVLEDPDSRGLGRQNWRRVQ